MNTNLAHIVKQIIEDNGEAVLNDPQRLKAFFSDLAKDEPKPLLIAFGCCIEVGAYAALKDTLDASDRAERKEAIAHRLRDEHGLDVTLCGEALDILEAALPEEKKETTLQTEITTGGQAGGGGLLSEEIGNLQKIIAEKNDQLIRCAKNIECLTEEKKQSEDEKEQIKDNRRAVIFLGIITVAISIGVGVSKYNEMEGVYYSLQYNYNKLSSDYEKLKALWAVNVTKLEVGNSNSSNWITKPGERLNSAAIRYLHPTIIVDSLTDGEIAFFVKIINPMGEVDRNQETSPAGYSYSHTVQISQTNNQDIALLGWGQSDRSLYSAGEWTVEVWYNDVCLRSEKVRIN
jgi:hypothetical protein